MKQSYFLCQKSQTYLRTYNNRIDVSALSDGVYIIKLENRSGDRFLTRLIKE